MLLAAYDMQLYFPVNLPMGTYNDVMLSNEEAFPFGFTFNNGTLSVSFSNGAACGGGGGFMEWKGLLFQRIIYYVCWKNRSDTISMNWLFCNVTLSGNDMV
mgnify:CR=1 FL=1